MGTFTNGWRYENHDPRYDKNEGFSAPKLRFLSFETIIIRY